MRTWTKPACVVIALGIVSICVVAVGIMGSARQAQANTRTAMSTEPTFTNELAVTSAFARTNRHRARYVVRPGDTLSGIAARFGVRGGWRALRAANRRAIGRNPNIIHVGTVLVLPGRMESIKYTIVSGDTLSGIAARFGVRGGWRALYAANRRAIGPNPNIIHAGTVLAILRSTAPSSPEPRRRHRPKHRVVRPSAPLSGASQTRPSMANRTTAPTGMPEWLKAMMLAAGLLMLMTFASEPVLALRRSRQQNRLSAADAHIVLADHDRLVVTLDEHDGTVYVLRPPEEDPREILRVARLVLPETPYRELAEYLGIPGTGSLELTVPAEMDERRRASRLPTAIWP